MKKTITLILAAMMTVSVSSAYAIVSEPAATEMAIQKKPKKQKAELKEVTFNVHLHCENCVKKVKENISFEKGVKDLQVSLEDQTVAIKYDASKTSEQVLKAAIEKLGYPVAGKAGQVHKHDHEHGHNHAH